VKLTSKERVLRAVRHEATDRLPLGYGAWRSVSERLCDYLHVDPACDWRHWQTYPEALLQRLGVDLRIVRARYAGPEQSRREDGSYVDIWGVRQSAENYPMAHPLVNATTAAEIHAYPWPDPDAYDYEHYAADCAEHGEYAVAGGDWSPFLFIAMELMGTENLLANMRLNPEVTHALLDRISDYFYTTTAAMLEAAGKNLDIFFMGDDYGTQKGPFMSRRDFNTFITPRLERFYRLAKAHDLIVMQHSCGSVRAVLPDLIDIGLDALDPIQVRAAGMDAAGLYRDFGHRITLHGSIDTQQTLPYGSAEDVAQEVRERIALAEDCGGFIIAGSQDYIDDIPPENIVAIYDTVREAAR
jgi:uroporphyrinogen decarboxylase